MKAFVGVSTAVVGLIVSGCGSKSLTVEPHADAGQRGVVYSLPRALLKVTVPYTMVKKTVVTDGITQQPLPTVDVRDAITIEPVYIADPNNRFVLDGSALWDSGWLDSNTKLTLTGGLLLAGIEADTADKGPEVVESLVSTALTAAKIAAAAGEAKGEPIESIRAKLKAIGDQIAAEVKRLSTPEEEAAKKRLTELTADRTLLLDLVRSYEASASETTELTKASYVITLDPADPETFKQLGDAGPYVCQIKPPDSLFGVTHATPTPVFIKVYAEPSAFAQAGTCVVVPDTEGVIYRPAMPTRVSATVGGAAALDGYISIPQFAKVAMLDAKYKTWGHMKTTARFDAVNGGLTEYAVDASSSAERAAKVLDTSATKLSTTLEAVRKAQADSAAAEAAKPAADLAQQQKLLQAQFDLDKLRAEYEAWKKAHGGNN